MKRIVNYVFERLFFIRPFKSPSSSCIVPCGYTTTMPCENMEFDEWEKGGWNEFLWGKK